MLKKIIAYLLVVAVVCTIIGGMTDVEFFSNAGIFGFCGAGVAFLILVFDKFFLSKEE